MRPYRFPEWLTLSGNIARGYAEEYALKAPEEMATHIEAVNAMSAHNHEEYELRIQARSRAVNEIARALGNYHTMVGKVRRVEVEQPPALQKMLQNFLSRVKEQQDENVKRARRRHLARWRREALRVSADPDNDYRWYGDENIYPSE